MNDTHRRDLIVPGEAAGERDARRDPGEDRIISELIALNGGDPATPEGRCVRDLLHASARLLKDGRDLWELRLISSAVKELRYAMRVFSRFAEPHKVTIFGSARTPESDPDFTACVEFSRLMAQAGWMVITGAGDGIMKAGHVGPGRDASFGVAIRLPFETSANSVISGDEKLINFRYFFTRKLMFMSQCEAVALFPGGFGTMDEAFEALTLIQTGKATMVPVVMLAGAGSDYWEDWMRWLRRSLLDRKFIGPEDLNLFKVCQTPRDAAEHIAAFYSVYHSSRYFGDTFVIRLSRTLPEAHLARLNEEFSALVKTGSIAQSATGDEEDDFPHLPRLSFHHTRNRFGLVRRLIDRINESPA